MALSGEILPCLCSISTTIVLSETSQALIEKSNVICKYLTSMKKDINDMALSSAILPFHCSISNTKVLSETSQERLQNSSKQVSNVCMSHTL